MHYPVVIHKDPDSDYGVTVPDLPGCFSAGSSIEEALQGAREAIECHLEGLLLDQEPLPPATEIEQHQQQGGYADGIWALVEVDCETLLAAPVERHGEQWVRLEPEVARAFPTEQAVNEVLLRLIQSQLNSMSLSQI